MPSAKMCILYHKIVKKSTKADAQASYPPKINPAKAG